MSEANPLDTCSVSKDDVTMDHEGSCLDHVIKMEEVDLEPDYIECNTDVKSEMTNLHDQTDDCDSFLNLAQHNNGDPVVVCYDAEIKAEVSRNDALELLSSQVIPSDLTTEIKIEEIDESDRDIFVEEDKINLTKASSGEIEPKAGVSKRCHTKNKSRRESGMYICNECSRKCVTRRNIVKHLTTHTGEKRFSCEFCEFKSITKTHLKVHLRRHTGEKPFSCEFCEYKCTRKASLKIHLRRHTGEKPFSCEFCEFKCITKSHLKVHLRRHTGEKPFSCEYCKYKCTNKSDLTKHLKTHTGEKPFSCEFCEFGFRPGLSTESAILGLKHTIQYYTDRRTPVFACFLDLSKAFDLVSYGILWRKLSDRGVPADLIRILQYWYDKQTNFVKWADSLSEPYGLECGVRQGGLASPRLFNLYINDHESSSAA